LKHSEAVSHLELQKLAWDGTCCWLQFLLGLTGIMIRDTVEATFKNPQITAGLLFGTAALLVIAEKMGKRDRELESVRWVDALVIGLAQILALFPGISRSGATIAGGMSRHLERKTAARFSFLMSVPIMLAAGIYSSLDLFQNGQPRILFTGPGNRFYHCRDCWLFIDPLAAQISRPPNPLPIRNLLYLIRIPDIGPLLCITPGYC